jgi:hypothetical protein
MKWITREHAKVDRIACPWLIRHFVDPAAEFIYVPAERVAMEAVRLEAVPFDVPGALLGHHDGRCSFEAILEAYHLGDDPVLAMLGHIVNGADTDNTLYNQPEGPGLKVITEGFRQLGLADDRTVLAAESIVYDALYAYCRNVVSFRINPPT